MIKSTIAYGTSYNFDNMVQKFLPGTVNARL